MVFLQTISAGVEGWSDTGVLYGIKGKGELFVFFLLMKKTKGCVDAGAGRILLV